MIISCAFSFILAICVAGYLDFRSNIPLFVLVLLFLVIFSLNKKYTIFKNAVSLLLSVAVFAGGIFWSIHYLGSMSEKADKIIEENRNIISGTVTGDITVYDYKSQFYIRLKNGMRVFVNLKSTKEVFPGDVVEIKDSNLFKVESKNIIKNYNRRLLGDGCMLYTDVADENFKITSYNNLYLASKCAYKLKKATFFELLKYMDYDSAASAYAMFTSDKTYMTEEINNKLINTGTIHIATVSGLHFVLLGNIIMVFLKLFLKSYRKRIAVLLILMTVFAFYAGFSIPVLRSYIVFSVQYLCDFFKLRKLKARELLVIVMCGFLLVSPMYVYDISFILTFVSTLSIVFFASTVEIWFNRKVERKIRLPIVSLIVALVMMPFIFAIFGRISLTSVITNYFVDFVVGPILVLTGLIGIFSSFSPFISWFLGMILRIFMKYFHFVISIFSKIENLNPQLPLNILSAIFIVSTLVIIVYIFVYRKKNLLKNISLLLCSALLFVWCEISPLNSKDAYITFFGNETCESIVISKNSHHIVVGSGKDMYYYNQSSALKRNEPIDLWIVTEYTDSYKMQEIMNNYNIKEVVLPNVLIDEKQKKTIKDIKITYEIQNEKLMYTLIEYEGEEVYISKNPDFIWDIIPTLKNATVILNTNSEKAYRSMMEYIKIDNSVKIYSGEKYRNIDYKRLSPYSIGIMNDEGFYAI